MRKSLTLFLFIAIGNLSLLGQGMPEVIPPSPNSASLGKYGEIPVDLNTGVANISIPLYTIQEGDITVPISLSFHASGNKVTETASWVGLGWSLNAGGVVTRSMRGRPDERHGYFQNINTVLGLSEIEKSYIYTTEASAISLAMRPVKEIMWDFHSKNKDLAADVFYYNHAGGAGKFMFDENQNVIQLPFKDLDIIPMNMSLDPIPGNGHIGGFLVKDPAGLEYTFDLPEETTVSYPSNEQDIYVSSWLLNGITSQVSQKSVDFGYSSPTLHVMDYFGSESISETTDEFYTNYAMNGRTESSSDITVGQKYLGSITWEGGQVEFRSSSNREDLVNGSGKRLDEIIVKNSSGEMISHYELKYDYFRAGTDAFGKQLKLTSINQLDKNGIPREIYKFEYHAGVPRRDSKAIDHLGFYNEKDGNNSLIPSFLRAGSGVTVIVGADRESAPLASIVGMIKSITYPTGGKSKFEYESHDHYVGSIIKNYPLSAKAENCDANGFIYQENGVGVIGVHCQPVKSVSFDLPSDSHNHSINIVTNWNTSNPPAITPGELELKIFEVDNLGSETLVWQDEPIELFNINVDLDQALVSGNSYRLESTVSIQGISLMGVVSYDAIDPTTVNAKTSGIRIKTISNYDLGVALPVKEINYNYNIEGSLEKSSGNFLAREPNYAQNYFQASSSSNGVGLDVTYTRYFTHSSSPTGVLGSLTSSHIIYGQVEVEESGNGSTRSFFSHGADELTPLHSDPPSRVEMPSSFWKTGHLIRKKIYNESDQLLQETYNEYEYMPKETAPSLVLELHVDFTSLGGTWYNSFRWGLTYQRSGWVKLLNTRNTYYDQGLEPVVKISNYLYDNPSHIMPTSMEYRFTDDAINPLDYTEELIYLNDRTNDNYVITPVVEKKVYNEANVLLSREVNTYSNFRVADRNIYDQGGSVIASMSFQDYHGLNPSYLSDHAGNRIEYLYDTYDQPIAKIINAEKGYSYYQNFESIGTSSQARTGEKSRAGGTYTVSTTEFDPPNESGLKMSYWYWEGSDWVFSGEINFNRNITTTGSYLDDLRIYPKEAQMTTYTYKQSIGMTSVTDPNNQMTTYEYDNYNRLKHVFDHEGNLVKANKYHYINE